SGEIILPDRLLMLFAKDIVSRNPGCDVIYDVKSTRRLNALISGYGGKPVMCKSGHSHIKAKMQETGALLGGELSGHIFFKERWLGFDDGLYAAARLLEIMTIRDQSLEQIMISFPATASTPEIKVPIAEDKKFSFIQQLIANGDFGEGKIITMDGLRAEYTNGWGLVRASNTSAALTLRFEADDDFALAEIMNIFREQISRIDSGLKLHF
ncbi:MAG: phosphomannomutase/phosphoglucomutase, partial [Pseudomonadales bacterium]|nr:phosphomannomutase/phosphoglucomutase [Pseudomonadales bacterium]